MLQRFIPTAVFFLIIIRGYSAVLDAYDGTQQHNAGQRVIEPYVCFKQDTREEGICMFSWNCQRANGTHLTFCMDRFYFGSCCKLPPEVSTTSPSTVQTTNSVVFFSKKTNAFVSATPKPQRIKPVTVSTFISDHRHKTTPNSMGEGHKSSSLMFATGASFPPGLVTWRPLESAQGTAVTNETKATKPFVIRVSTRPSLAWTAKPRPGNKVPQISRTTTSLTKTQWISSSQAAFSSKLPFPLKTTKPSKTRPSVSVPVHSASSETSKSTTEPQVSQSTRTKEMPTASSVEPTVTYPPYPITIGTAAYTHIEIFSESTTSDILPTTFTLDLPSGSINDVNGVSESISPSKGDATGEEIGQTPTMTAIATVCGRPRPGPTGRIVGGEQSHFGEWPWVVSLRQWKKNTFLHKCGAALLNEFWAITAAHCVENVPLTDILLRLGEYDISNENEPLPFVERRVQIVASHPKFDRRTFEYDLALLRFYEPVVFQRNIIPVCVPQGNNSYVGKHAIVTGWGRLYEDGPLPDIIQKVALPVITNSVCEAMYRKSGFIEDIPDIFICAGYGNGGKDSCEGDSGGPMVIQEDDGRWVLAGVISWGIGCALPNQPGVYTRITKFSEWINQIIIF